MTLVADAAAVVLATVLGLACVSKLRAWSTFVSQVRLLIPGSRVAAAVAVGLVALEAAAAGLLISPLRPIGGVTSAGLFLVFGGYVSLTGKERHERDGCGCFGRLPVPVEDRLSLPWRISWRVFAAFASIFVATAASSRLVDLRAVSLGIASLFVALLVAGVLARRAPRAEVLPAASADGRLDPTPDIGGPAPSAGVLNPVGTMARRGVLAGGMGVVAGTILTPGWWLPAAGAQTAQCDCDELLFLCQVRAVAAGIVCTTISGPIAACACLHGVTGGIGCCQECANECSGVDDGCDHDAGSPCAENQFVSWPDAC